MTACAVIDTESQKGATRVGETEQTERDKEMSGRERSGEDRVTDGEEEDKDSVDHSADDRDRCPPGLGLLRRMFRAARSGDLSCTSTHPSLAAGGLQRTVQVQTLARLRLTSGYGLELAQPN